RVQRRKQRRRGTMLAAATAAAVAANAGRSRAEEPESLHRPPARTCRRDAREEERGRNERWRAEKTVTVTAASTTGKGYSRVLVARDARTSNTKIPPQEGHKTTRGTKTTPRRGRCRRSCSGFADSAACR
ncbi:unnamed protein product, partial [Ectocarpus sp. 12 AP-2014]